MCLFPIIQYRGLHENIRVDRDYEWRPALPSAAISAISSIASGLVPGRYPQPMKLSIDSRICPRALPDGRSAADLSSLSGLAEMPQHFLAERVTCPFAVPRKLFSWIPLNTKNQQDEQH